MKRKNLSLEIMSTLARRGLSVRAIGKHLLSQGMPCSASTIARRLVELRSGCNSTMLFQPQPVRKLSDRTGRYLARQVLVHGVRLTRGLHQDLTDQGYKVSRKTVLRKLHSVPTLRQKRPRQRVALSREHQAQRHRWAIDNLSGQTDWSKCLFADEKQWYLDGPVWRPKVWCDIRGPPPTNVRSGRGNKCVSVWGAFSVDCVPGLQRLPKALDSDTYCETLKKMFLALPDSRRLVLCHDKHSAHTSKQTTTWLKRRRVPCLLLPAKAADLNPIENLWGWLSREVYEGNRRYKTEDELYAAICLAWQRVQSDRDLRYNLALSIPRRLQQVVDRQGACCDF